MKGKQGGGREGWKGGGARGYYFNYNSKAGSDIERQRIKTRSKKPAATAKNIKSPGMEKKRTIPGQGMVEWSSGGCVRTSGPGKTELADAKRSQRSIIREGNEPRISERVSGA